MREEVQVVEESPVDHGQSIHRVLLREGETPGSGFTAVNGDLHRLNTTFRPEEHVRQGAQEPARTDSTMGYRDMAQNRQQHSWRSADRNDSVHVSETGVKSSPGSMKRKRSQEPADDAQRSHPIVTGRESPKRRHTDMGQEALPRLTESALNGANDELRSMEHMLNPSNSRERSPVPTRNQREPPPQVRPETEAHLAESLASHLHSVNQSAGNNEAHRHPTDQPTAVNDGSPTSETATYNDGMEYSPDDTGGEHGSKRKRNFSNRTKTGCHTCRSRKKKCDEAKPHCNNCIRGNFQCHGYGPKPPNIKGLNGNNRSHIPLQSKQYEQPPAPTGHYQMEPRYDHWGKVPPPPPPPESYGRYPEHDPRTVDARDSWQRHPPWPHHPEPAPYQSGVLPPVEYSHIAPHPSHFPHEPPPPPPPPEHWPHPLMPAYRPHQGPGTTISSRESVGTSSSQRAPQLGPLTFPTPGQMSEKEKMLLGKPYLHYIDDVLLDDRQQCKFAIERYNNAARPSEAISSDERSRFFSAVIDPAKRNVANQNYRDVSATIPTMLRPGRIGHRTIVEAPFNCDYGYNINLGNDVVVGAGCYMQDPCEVIIGNRTIIGPNVRFYGNSASVDPTARKGSQGMLTGGAIIVEDDVFIGGDAIILPHRVIGKGAVVGAGSVVTKNVLPNTVVAGNPAREIRTLGPGSVEDRRMRAAIQAENDQSMRDARARRGYRE